MWEQHWIHVGPGAVVSTHIIRGALASPLATVCPPILYPLQSQTTYWLWKVYTICDYGATANNQLTINHKGRRTPAWVDCQLVDWQLVVSCRSINCVAKVRNLTRNKSLSIQGEGTKEGEEKDTGIKHAASFMTVEGPSNQGYIHTVRVQHSL